MNARSAADYFLIRNQDWSVISTHDSVVFVSQEGRIERINVQDVDSLISAIERLTLPVKRSLLELQFSSHSDHVENLMDRLVDIGACLVGETPQQLLMHRNKMFTRNNGFHFEPAPSRCKHLVIAMTGSIFSGLFAPAVLSIAFSHFADRIDIILTSAASHFVNAELFEWYGLTVWRDGFSRQGSMCVPHIELSRSASVLLVLPASADSIHRISQGTCSDLLSLVAAATSAPVVVAPTMNSAMWGSRAVRRNARCLRNDGHYIIEPCLGFEAADVLKEGEPMIGAPGYLWGGPRMLMEVLNFVMGDSEGEKGREFRVDRKSI